MSRLDNLGDYNIVRDDLFRYGGDVKKLYKSIGDTAVAEKAPTLLIIGGAIALVVDFGTRAIVKYMKNRKKLLDDKPNLEREFAEQMEKISTPIEYPAEESGDKEI